MSDRSRHGRGPPPQGSRHDAQSRARMNTNFNGSSSSRNPNNIPITPAGSRGGYGRGVQPEANSSQAQNGQDTLPKWLKRQHDLDDAANEVYDSAVAGRQHGAFHSDNPAETAKQEQQAPVDRREDQDAFKVQTS